MIKILTLLTLSLGTAAASAEGTLDFRAGVKDTAPPYDEGQTLSWGAALSRWHGITPDAANELRYDVGDAPVGGARDEIVVLSNGWRPTATDIAVQPPAAPFYFKGGVFPGEGGTCGAELPGISACKLVLTFAPTEIGPVSRPLALSYRDAGNERTLVLNLDGQGVPLPTADDEARP